MTDCVDSYNDNGYAILRNVFSSQEVEQIKNDLVTSTMNNLTQLLPQVALERLSSYKNGSSEFWSELPAVQYVHKLQPSVQDLLNNEQVLTTLNNIIGKNIKCIQSIFFLKPPGSVGTPWHQDETYLPTRDRSLLAVWIALSDTNKENGAIEVIAKSHKPGILYNLDSTDVDRKIQRIGEWETKESIVAEVKAGDVVLFNGYTLHSSGFNLSKNKDREAIVFHVMSAESLFPYKSGICNGLINL